MGFHDLDLGEMACEVLDVSGLRPGDLLLDAPYVQVGRIRTIKPVPARIGRGAGFEYEVEGDPPPEVWDTARWIPQHCPIIRVTEISQEI